MSDSTEGRSVSLADKYTLEDGRAMITGTQALVRLLLDQRRLDTARGLNTGLYVSGYPGSPLGGLDLELGRARKFVGEADIVFHPGVNEELAATAVNGTQLVPELPGRRLDGVVGVWYGKTPGLDRAADAIRHGNVSGTSHLGGALALIGDDPSCKSSTLPGSCEAMARSLVLPLLAPSSIAEIRRLGLHAVALSRFSGTWAGMKIVSDIADGAATIPMAVDWDEIPAPPGESRGSAPILLAPSSVEAEHDLFTKRLERIRAYAREARLNRVHFEPARPRLGLVAAGLSFATLLRALEDLGIGEDQLDALGIRLIRIDMPWPLDRETVRELNDGLEEVLVIEDKLAFLETHIKEALYGVDGAPRVLGKEDREGRPLVPSKGSLDADAVARALGQILPAEQLPESAEQSLARLVERETAAAGLAPESVRTPFFCSGCPHNISTKDGADQLVGAGIGCHSLVAVDPSGQRGSMPGGAPQMGGEGAQWLGMSPFTADAHFVQNIGDGTFHHSGSLAIRAAVAGGANMTFKLLYNSAVAMTGGQQPEGRLDVPSLTRWLALEGVKRVVVTTPEPGTYGSGALDPIASVRHRDDFAEAERELAAVEGVTVLIHDDQCATEERRMRKRGKLEAPPERAWINRRVCEGCGDCGHKSTCLSVIPIDTELGRKTEIHQSSCNQDFACLEGDCPSFMVVVPGKRARRELPAVPGPLPEPIAKVDGEDVLIRMPGIGGTGVVTISQVLQMAAHLDGRFAAGLDQTGLAQKGGPVTSDVRLSATPIRGAHRASTAAVDVILGLDMLGAAMPATLQTGDPERTIAVVNKGQLPTAAMTAAGAPRASVPRMLRKIDRSTRAADNLYVDALGIAEALFDDHMPTNMILLGAAYQHGCIPVSAARIEEAIRLNGAAIDANLAAFGWGRAAVANPTAVEEIVNPPEPFAPVPAKVSALLDQLGATGNLRQLLEVRAADLVGFQDFDCAAEYVRDVMAVAVAEAERGAPGETAIAESYARGLHKLVAYKDEYEVARLHLDEVERVRLDSTFGERAKVTFLLHPPMLRTMGMKKKMHIPAPVARPLFRSLYASRRLRGTRLDPFGRAKVRRIERELVGEYRALMASAMARLTPQTHAEVAEVAELPELVRGYEEIKLGNVERFRLEASRRLEALGRESSPSASISVVPGRTAGK
jgi:indolepyruvate ferredoxin oxidoreductase